MKKDEEEEKGPVEAVLKFKGMDLNDADGS